jgi:hypothetical protein
MSNQIQGRTEDGNPKIAARHTQSGTRKSEKERLLGM